MISLVVFGTFSFSSCFSSVYVREDPSEEAGSLVLMNISILFIFLIFLTSFPFFCVSLFLFYCFFLSVCCISSLSS